MTSLQDIQNYANKIAERFKPEKIILFGSYANGKPNEDSDVDLFVVMDHEGKGWEKAAEISLNVEPPFAMDLLVRKKIDLTRYVKLGDPFYREVAKHGVVLYEG
jgi:uncharacterized protein